MREIQIHQLTKVYKGKVTALRGVDLQIRQGVFGLLGPNGAGKTTLMRILAGILRPTTGTVRMDGHDGGTGSGRTAIQRVLGYLPQELGLYPDLNAREFLDYIAILKAMDEPALRRQRIDRVLDMVHLTDVAERKLKTYSNGMKRRVGIAQALLNDPQLLIVDEPTAGLDPEERIRFRNLLSDLGENRIVLLSTHIVEDISQTCRNVALMASGRVIFQGTTAGLAESAKGKVWTLTTSGPKPRGNLTIISTHPQGAEVQYRVLGDLEDRTHAHPLAPSVEEGYLWLLHQARRP